MNNLLLSISLGALIRQIIVAVCNALLSTGRPEDQEVHEQNHGGEVSRRRHTEF